MKFFVNSLVAVIIFLSSELGYAVETNKAFCLYGSASVFDPREDEDWDRALGGEVKFAYWLNKTIGLALAGGAQNWEVNEKSVSEELYVGSRGAEAKMELTGDALMIPVGASLLLDFPLSEKISLQLEGGARYVFVDSNVEYEYELALVDLSADVYHGYSGKGDIDIDDGIIGLAAVDIEAAFNASFSIFLGGGYQFDIDKCDVGDDDDTKLEAVFGRAGGIFKF